MYELGLFVRPTARPIDIYNNEMLEALYVTSVNCGYGRDTSTVS
jgi:hypothetical protein